MKRSLFVGASHQQSSHLLGSPWTSPPSCRWILNTATRMTMMILMTTPLRSVRASFLVGAPTSRRFLAAYVRQSLFTATTTNQGPPKKGAETGGPRSFTAPSSSSTPTSLQQHPSNREEDAASIDVSADTTPSSPFSLPTFLDPLIVCGPSGAGKGTLIHKYMTECGGSNHFAFGVSHTTRPPRHGEIAGIHYHFVSPEEMFELRNQNAFLECAHVHGNWYGTSWTALHHVQSQGKRGLLDIDVQGVQRIQHLASSSTSLSLSSSDDDVSFPATTTTTLRPRYVFVAPPSLDALEQRLVGRGSESPETLSRRLANAAAELDFGLSPNNNFDAVVINADLDQAVQELDETIRRLYNLE